MEVGGLYDHDEDIIYVTLSQGNRHWVCVHEYIHASKYRHDPNGNKEHEEKVFKCAKNDESN